MYCTVFEIKFKKYKFWDLYRFVYMVHHALHFILLIFLVSYSVFYISYLRKVHASRGAAVRSVTVIPTGFGFDPHSRRWNIYLNLYFHFFALVSMLSAALSSATHHAMPPEFGRKWGTECLNTRFPLPTLLCAGNSVRLIFFLKYMKFVMDVQNSKKYIKIMCGHLYLQLFDIIKIRWYNFTLELKN